MATNTQATTTTARKSFPFAQTIFVSGRPDRGTNDFNDITYHGEEVDREQMGDEDEVAEYQLIRSGKVITKMEVIFL